MQQPCTMRGEPRKKPNHPELTCWGRCCLVALGIETAGASVLKPRTPSGPKLSHNHVERPQWPPT